MSSAVTGAVYGSDMGVEHRGVLKRMGQRAYGWRWVGLDEQRCDWRPVWI
jgi:23S rRNA A1618 N6-methylase RlmF